MRKEKTVKIDLDEKSSKDFKLWELTIEDIITLSQGNQFFKSDPPDDIKKSQSGENSGEPSSFLVEFKEYLTDLNGIMEKTCDFTLDELKPLAPSDVKRLWDGWQEVNQDFLFVLAKLQILEIGKQLLSKHIKSFSKMLAIL